MCPQHSVCTPHAAYHHFSAHVKCGMVNTAFCSGHCCIDCLLPAVRLAFIICVVNSWTVSYNVQIVRLESFTLIDIISLIHCIVLHHSWLQVGDNLTKF